MRRFPSLTIDRYPYEGGTEQYASLRQACLLCHRLARHILRENVPNHLKPYGKLTLRALW